jgi:ornithine cyclodeaminase/alanine dehydrogenase-like protein (mu-crystallin family)
MTVPVVPLSEIETLARPDAVLAAVRQALIAHAEGRTMVPAPIHLGFPASGADCHVKAGWIEGAADFAVKIASGSHRNAERGLPTNHGLVCVLSAQTGEVRAVLDDEGWLTAWRTAAAGALITDALARGDAETVGVFGTGEQARLQVEWLARLRPVRRVSVHGRDDAKAAAVCAWLADRGIEAAPESAAGTAAADIVIATTAATQPVFDADFVRVGAHVTGMGTDMPHKNELPAGLFARADVIATDDHGQCLDHGDFGRAVGAGAVAADADVSVGAVLRDGVARTSTAITVADLTGVGALDAAVAALVTSQLFT